MRYGDLLLETVFFAVLAVPALAVYTVLSHWRRIATGLRAESESVIDARETLVISILRTQYYFETGLGGKGVGVLELREAL